VPAATCPNCQFVVTSREDQVGTLQCPACGEEILQGRPASTRVQTWPQAGDREANEDDRIAQSRPARVRYLDEDDSPRRHVPSGKPEGVSAAGVRWLVCGILGFVVNLLFLVGYFVAVVSARAQAVRLPDGWILPGLGLAFLTIVYFPSLIVFGYAIDRGTGRYVQVPAGFVLFVALILLPFHTFATGGSGALLLTSLGGHGFSPPRMEVLLLQGALFGGFLVLLVVDVILLRSSAVLLWQSARYAHWFNRGNSWSSRDSDSQYGFPGSIGLAASIWAFLGGLGVLAILGVGRLLLLVTVDPVFAGVVVIIGLELALIPLLTTFYLGVLLFAGRLPSTLPAGVAFLVLAVLGVAYNLANLFRLNSSSIPFGLDHDLGFLFPQWGWVFFPVGLGLSGLAILASIACIAGNDAYQRWLRTERGLNV
jgi:hypothetical protein